MTGIQLSAVDTLHFRDSTVHAASQTSPEHLSGQYPPHPATVVGAVRAWLARAGGWNGGGDWGDSITEVLGSGYGPESLGRLRFDGPYLLREGEPLFPMPAHVLGKDGSGWQPDVLLGPGPAVTCDLGGEVNLPGPVPAERKPGKAQWVTRAGLAAVLRGRLPDQAECVAAGTLWREEPRIGIQRDYQTRTVQEGMLYSARHVRPEAGKVGVGVRIEGDIPEEWWHRRSTMLQFGGEGRSAEVQTWDGEVAITPPMPEITSHGQAVVIALTPIDADDDSLRIGGRVPELGDATIASACLPRVERVGGWANAGGVRGPRPLRSLLPAGSTLFCRIGDPDGLRAAVERAGGPLRLGRYQKWGFGAVAIGVWPYTAKGAK